MRCSRCQAAFFCGPNCQRRSWKDHQALCISSKVLAHKEEQFASAQVPTCGSSESTAESDASDRDTFDNFLSPSSLCRSGHADQHQAMRMRSKQCRAETVEAQTIVTTRVISAETEDIRNENDIWKEAYWAEAYTKGHSDAMTMPTTAETQANEIKDVGDAYGGKATISTQGTLKGADDGCCIPPAERLIPKLRLLHTLFNLDDKSTDELVPSNCPCQIQ